LEGAEHIEEMRSVYGILVRKPDGKKLLGKPRHRVEEDCSWQV
jgi:hypothetical protein